jgi:hypothetical protein
MSQNLLNQNLPESLAIVAMGRTHHEYTTSMSQRGTPYRVYDEVWTLNGMGEVLVADRYFLMDDLEIQEARAESNQYIKGIVEWAKRCHKSVYTTRKLDGYPGLIEYPLEYVLKKVGVRPYFTNSVPYMLAFAIAEGFKRIAIYGCDYTYGSGDSRTEKGRACLEYWCGVAEAKGIQVYVPPSSSLLEGGGSSLYGYWAEDVSVDSEFNVNRIPKEKLPTAAEVEATMQHHIRR